MGRERGPVLRLQFGGLDIEQVAAAMVIASATDAQGHVRRQELRLQRRRRLDLEADEQDVGDEVGAEHQAPGGRRPGAVRLPVVRVRLGVRAGDIA